MGFTGNPFSYCTDIDECSLADLNTCSGGLYPQGYDIDINSKDGGLVHEDRWVPLGDTNEDDGYSQDVQFELRGQRGIYLLLHECNDTTVCPSFYSFDIGNGNGNQNNRFQIWKNGVKMKDKESRIVLRINAFFNPLSVKNLSDFDLFVTKSER